MDIKSLLSHWRSDPAIAPNVVSWQVQPQRNAVYEPFPPYLDQRLQDLLTQGGISSLYSHQVHALSELNDRHHIAIVTATASGKTLCYNLPVLNVLLNQPQARALYLFPTKALTQDQLANLRQLTDSLDQDHCITSNIYDGDTPTHARQLIRKQSQIIMTNPDMLHTGILPHHTAWKDFFNTLNFVVIDEMHMYRGVFGSHVANVIRRLKRITRFYGAQPQFILTSATIANPQELAEKLIEEPVTLVDQDGAPQGQRHFLIYNPPLVDQKLGLRKSSLLEGALLASETIRSGFQTIVFGRTRRSIELILTYLRDRHPNLPAGTLRGYRSGYLRDERRNIEEGLRKGKVRAVVATSALELGIDIGALEAAVIIGYPGSIAATKQEAGRAGRKENTSLAILVTAANAMDQYLAHHPEFFFERSPEQALLEADNLLILLQHIRCAAFELPFSIGHSFGKIEPTKLQAFLELLSNSGELFKQDERYYWMADQYPAADISLRSASPDNISLLVETSDGFKTVGQVDRLSSYWMVHPDAIYIHEGQPYFVEDLDLEAGVAHMRQVALDYYTHPRSETTIEDHTCAKETQAKGCKKFFGELTVINQVIGYQKIRWFTREHIGSGEVHLPPTRLDTVGYWLAIDEAVITQLRSEMLWNSDANDYGRDWKDIRQKVLKRDDHRCKVCGTSAANQTLHVHHIQPLRSFSSLETANKLQNLITLCPACHQLAEQNIRIRSGLAGFAYALGNLTPLLLMCTREDIGIHTDPQSPLGNGQPTIVIYDNIPGGIGLSERIYDQHEHLLRQVFETISTCPCLDGCPSCVGPIGEDGYGGKKEAQALLAALI